MLVPSVKPTVGFYIYRRQDQKLHRCLIIKRCQHQLCIYIFPACCIFLIKFFLLFFSIRRTLLKPTSEALWTWWGPAWERGRRWSAWSWHRRSPPCSTTAGRRCKAATMGMWWWTSRHGPTSTTSLPCPTTHLQIGYVCIYFLVSEYFTLLTF